MFGFSGSRPFWAAFLFWIKKCLNCSKIIIFIPTMPKRTLKPLHQVLLQLDKPLSDTLKMGNLELYLDPSWHPEQHVTVTGKVVGLPKNHPYGNELNINDTVAFSYMVVADREFDDEPENFHPRINEENLKIFYNAKNEKIQIRAIQGAITKQFACCFWDSKGEFTDGFQGMGYEMERWLSQFKFGNVQRYRFTNCIELDGQLYWKCDYDQIFAKKVGKKLIALGDRLILNPIQYKLTEEDLKKNGIDIPLSALSNITLSNAARVESAPKGVNVKKGDKIGFDTISCEKYEFFGKNYYLVNKQRIQGIWN